MAKKRVGILTGGGDCPGLNAVIRGIVKSACHGYDMEVIGFMDGFLGLIEKRWSALSSVSASGILTQGGTILGTTNKADPFAHAVECGGKKEIRDVSDDCVKLYHELGLDALICLGGDGTQSMAGKFAAKGMNVVGVPKTIDKDVAGTDETFGFDSARAMATEAIDRLHTTASAHQRIMLVEVMGRNAGWLALESCIAGGGDIALIPEIPFEIPAIAAALKKRNEEGKRFSIIVVAEGAYPHDGKQVTQSVYEREINPIRLGGVSHVIANMLERSTGMECRVAVLGHLQRGGTPTPYDRLLATRFAIKAMDLVVAGEFNRMVALINGQMDSVPIKDVVNRQKVIPLDSPLIRVAKAVGTSFGAAV